MPPPLPFFAGKTIDALERHGSLQVRPRPGHAFSSPPGTYLLYLEAKRLLTVALAQSPDDGSTQIEFHGDFQSTGYGERVVLGPIDPDDASALVAALAGRYALPRRPRPCSVQEILRDDGHAHADEFVVTTGTYQPRHIEAADFDGISLRGNDSRRAALVPGQRFVVTGFVEPGPRIRPGFPIPVGYVGVSLRAMTIAPEVLPPVPYPTREGPPGPRRASHAGVTFFSAVERGDRGQEHADFFSARQGEFCVVALVDGGGDHPDASADVCRWALSDLLGETAYGPPLPRLELEPPLGLVSHHPHWTSYLLDRAPLPADPEGLLDALDSRLHDLFQRLDERERFVQADGVLACVSADRIRLRRRGIARVYLVREGRASVVVHEHNLAHEFAAQGKSPEEVLATRGICLSVFGGGTPTDPVDLALRPGDRLVIVTYEALLACEDTPLLDAVTEPSLATLLAALRRGDVGREKGWAVVALDVTR